MNDEGIGGATTDSQSDSKHVNLRAPEVGDALWLPRGIPDLRRHKTLDGPIVHPEFVFKKDIIDGLPGK